MGYACYDTPLGPAGYAVEDTCHTPNCTTVIDRGLGHLCGSDPGYETESGCGRWYCGEHLYGGQCGPCLDAAEPAESGGPE